MTTHLLSDRKSNSRDNVRDLELFRLIWLDNNSEGNRSAEEKMRNIVTDFVKFEDVTLCQQYIQQIPADNRLVLMVSSRLGKKLIPFIHKLQQVSLICVYYVNNKTNDQWIGQYGKVA